MSSEPIEEKQNHVQEIETDETAVTEIRIAPDGRMRIFGLSRELLALLCETGLADESLRQRLPDETNEAVFNSTAQCLLPRRNT